MKAFDSTVTVERVKGLLSYNPDTGIFTWRVDRNPWHLKGMVAGGVSTFGHMTISVDKKRLMAHRVAWAITHGDWPKTDIDHINGDPADNRMLNLRMVTRGHNLQNQKKAHHDSKSGLLGVEVRVGKRKTLTKILSREGCRFLSKNLAREGQPVFLQKSTERGLAQKS